MAFEAVVLALVVWQKLGIAMVVPVRRQPVMGEA